MDFFERSEERFRGRDYFKLHSGKTELEETNRTKSPLKPKLNLLDNSTNPEATCACSQIMN